MENALTYLASILPTSFENLICVKDAEGLVYTSSSQIIEHLKKLSKSSNKFHVFKKHLSANIYWTHKKVFKIETDRSTNSLFCSSELRIHF